MSVVRIFGAVLASCLCGGAGAAELAAPSVFAEVTADRHLNLPADFGAHPQFRTEWWYVTGWLTTGQGQSLGFQITFFRTKPGIDERNPSAFAPRQLLIAHCALSDPGHGRLWQDQRIRRAGLGLADASESDTDVHIDRWSLRRGPQSYAATVDAADFSFELTLSPTQEVMVNGRAGISRKGPSSKSASYYYSEPHLRAAGKVVRGERTEEVSGEAWLDHEWSSEYLDAEAVGWEWTGINMDDGGAAMVFSIRDGRGGQRWAGGTLRAADGRVQVLEPSDVEFRAGRSWISPRTGIAYPVEWLVRAGTREMKLVPLLDDQENDTRLSTGAIYWEGAVRVSEKDRAVGRGYLELTGYGERLRLR
jgi:predicted secreted hydrolase